MIVLTVVIATAVLIAVFELGRGLGQQQGAMNERLRHERASEDRAAALNIYLETFHMARKN